MTGTASLYINDSGNSAQIGPMNVEQAVAKFVADSATYRRTFYALIFTDCTVCGGEGFDEGRRCKACVEREESLCE